MALPQQAPASPEEGLDLAGEPVVQLRSGRRWRIINGTPDRPGGEETPALIVEADGTSVGAPQDERTEASPP